MGVGVKVNGKGVLVCIYVLHISRVVSCTYTRTILIKLHKIVLLRTCGILTDISERVSSALYNAFVGDRIALMTALQRCCKRSDHEVA